MAHDGSWIFIQLILYFILLEGVNGQCDGTGSLELTADSFPQYFTSPNYPSNYPAHSDCSWRITAPSVYEKIIINIEDYDSESTTSDYMDLYDGYNSSATLIIRMAGTNRKTLNAFVSSDDVLYITFVSDHSIQYSGFQILYFSNDTANQPACDTTLDVADQDQILMSPNLPNAYAGSQVCSWSFSSTTGILFQIKFLDMGGCGQSHLRFYDGNSTDDNQLDTICSTALVYEFDDIETTIFTGHVAWTVTAQPSDYYGFMLVYRTNVVTTTSTTTTTTTVTTTTLAPGIFDNCTASGAYMTAVVSPNFAFIYSPEYASGHYPNNKFCRWYVTAPVNYAVEAYFDEETFYIESNIYCRYDYVVFYDGNTTSATMLNKFCGSERPTPTYRSSGDQMLIIFSSDYTLQYSGFRIRVRAVDNTYPACKTDYTEYPVVFSNPAVVNTISTPNYGVSDYENNIEVFWLFTNADTVNYKMVLEIIYIRIERSYGCIFDRLVLYDGPCIKDGVRDTVCSSWAKRWDLEGSEYLLHFHSDGYHTLRGFELQYYAEAKAVIAPPTTTTTTFGPPVESVVDAVKSLLTNYSSENLPARNLSNAITVSIDFFLVGINGLDEVEQKLTSTGQFEVTWDDASLSWDPEKRQRIVKVLLPQDDLWKPDIALMNGFAAVTAMGAKFMFIDVNYNGSCIWKPYQIMESVCKVDMTHYPYDRQTCILMFGTWATDDSEVLTELGSLGLQIHPNFQEHSEWRLVKTETRQEDKNHHKTVEFVLTLERNSQFVTFYMTMPIVVLAYMNVFTFVIPAESGEKSGFSITLFLSFLVILIINYDSMPENSETISMYAAFVLAMTILSTVALIVCTLQIRALTFSESMYPISKRVKKAMRHIKWVQSILTCRGKKNKIGHSDDVAVESKLNNKLVNEKLFVDLNAKENEAKENEKFTRAKPKKVSFKEDYDDDVDDEPQDDNDRFLIPLQREISNVTFKYNRENTLFDADTLVRSATQLSISSKEKTDKQNLDREHTPQPQDINDHEFDLDRNILPVKSVIVSPLPEYDDKPVRCDENHTEPSASFPDNIDYENIPKGSSKNQHIQVTSISNFEPYTNVLGLPGDQVPNPLSENIRPDSASVKTEPNQSGNAKQKSLVIEDRVSETTFLGVESKRILGNSYQSSTITSDVAEIEPSSSYDFKMNRPSSTMENRPLSVNRQFCSAGSRSILVNNGRAVSAMNRPLSQGSARAVSAALNRPLTQGSGSAISAAMNRPLSRASDRAISVLSNRSVPHMNQRPVSSFSHKYSTAFVFESEETARKLIDTETDASNKSSSESSENSIISDKDDSNNLSWPDLVSCTDVLFFLIYLLLTTLMILAMFMTMITAY